MINFTLERLARFGSILEEWATRKIIARKQKKVAKNRPLTIKVTESEE